MVILLKNTLVHFYSVEVLIMPEGSRQTREQKVRLWIGPFARIGDRTVWKRAFWKALSEDARYHCGGELPKTLRFADARRFKADVNPRSSAGTPNHVARHVQNLARIKSRSSVSC